MVKELLNVVNGKKVLTIHGHDDSIPNLQDKNLQMSDL
jgi:hypothetical protein